MASGNIVRSPFDLSIRFTSPYTFRSQANELRLGRPGLLVYPLATLPSLPQNREESELLRRHGGNS